MMNPHIEKIEEDGDNLSFILKDVNVSIANGLRRTILSDIPTVVFKTSPYEQNKSNIITNTSRLNNEIIKQRLSCIPIHISDLNMPLENYIMEVNVENLTDTIIYVTTEDFKIKNIINNEYLSEKDQKEIFPPNSITGDYIEFVRLRPRISEEISGEKLHITCNFSISNSKDDGMFNVVSTCTYGFTQDDVQNGEIINKKKQELKDKGMTKEEIEFEIKNYLLLDAQRVIKRNSFDFIIQTLGVFTNQKLIQNACDIIINKFKVLDTIIDTDELKIAQSENTMKNCYDIILENEDYTIGKVLEYLLYSSYYEGLKTLSFCGFKKLHPHDLDSIIRIAYKEDITIMDIKQNLKKCFESAIIIYTTIHDKF